MIIEKAPPSMGTVGCDGEPYTWRRQPEKWRPIDRRTVLYSRVCVALLHGPEQIADLPDAGS